MRSRSAAAAALVLILLVAAAFGGAVRQGFQDVDDPQYVTDNPEVRAGLTASGVVWAATAMHAANWHPLTWLSHMADVSLYGMDPRGHHATNLALHALAAALLFLALRRMTGRGGPALAAAALFAIHPLRVESVVWVAERKDVLSMALAAATLYAYAGYARAPSRGRLVGVTALAIAALLAKPMMVTLPIVLLLLDVWPLGRAGSLRDLVRLVPEKAAMLAASAASAVLTVVAQSRGAAVEPLDTLGLPVRLANAAVAAVTYLRQSVWPSDLACFYPHAGYVHTSDLAPIRVAAAVAILLGLTALAALVRRAHPWVPVGWAWYLVTLLPVIGIVQVGEQAHADRYTYLPMIGPAIALVWSVDALAGRAGAWGRRAAVAAAVLAIAALGTATRAQVGLWADPIALYRQALAHTDRNYAVHNNLGVEYGKKGDLAAAEREFDEALRIVPEYAIADDNLGTVLLREGRPDEAIPHFRSALARSGDPEIRNNLGNALIAAGRIQEGIREFRDAIRIRPDYALAHFNLAMELGRLGRDREALSHFDAAIRYRPDRAEAWANRGLLLATMGRKREAASDFREALALKPDWPDVRRALERVER